MLLTALLLWFLVSGVVIIAYARRDMAAGWREPVLRRPVMIVESDDWGAGPAEQALVLEDIRKLLTSVSDTEGRHPVMTLGVILAAPDGGRIWQDNRYSRRVISTQTHADLLKVIQKGTGAGVFSVQLHGMEHFWPAALLAAAKTNRAVSDWLQQTPAGFTEELPAALQSRWIDASVLPSKPLPTADIRDAVAEEVEAFNAVFGVRPAVVVPPTFIWNAAVEQAWADADVKVIVTPGHCIEQRDADGRPVSTGLPLYNSQAGAQGIVYLVRDVYFEPSLGHSAEQALIATDKQLRLGRPVLFEMHRFNFIGPRSDPATALRELGCLLHGAVKKIPDVAFISTAELAKILRTGSSEWVEHRPLRRVHVWIERLRVKSRLRKMVVLSGWILPVWLIWKLGR